MERRASPRVHGVGATVVGALLTACTGLLGLDEVHYREPDSTGGASGAGGDGDPAASSAGGESAASGGGGAGGVDGRGAGGDPAGTGGSVGAGGGAASGCADGAREGYAVAGRYATIAACAGAWSVPGLKGPDVPSCSRAAGDDGAKADGDGCAAYDLCAAGWHVCLTSAEVAGHAGVDGCEDAVDASSSDPVFFATAQSGNGSNACAATGADDIFGCGNVGSTIVQGCEPLDRGSGNDCLEIGAPWSCPSSTAEAATVTKSGSLRGGVLCCAD
jgi:hypothetical protein